MQSHRYTAQLNNSDFVTSYGFIKTVGNSYIEADGPRCSIGDICAIELDRGAHQSLTGEYSIEAEVVGIQETHITLVPFQQNVKIGAHARVVAKSGNMGYLPVGDGFAGRAIDALGNAIDDQGPITVTDYRAADTDRSATLDRTSTAIPLETGIKSIDTLLTLAKGQRIGIFAAAGVGKTTLIEQIARQVEADRIVVCLVGERGQEVQAMWQSCQAMPDRDRYTLVASTSDESAALRVRGPNYALALAEYWRDKGEHVLLILDSATRLAMALREVGLAAGEPPTVRAYTPGVFSAMPRFVEKCGALKSGGAISAVMTVLAEQEEADDPLCEMMKSILDGHIILSRSMAEQGQFPAIDVGRSISRQAAKVVNDGQATLAQIARKHLAIYEESRTFVESGVYRKGTNPELDQAIDIRTHLTAFLSQKSGSNVPMATAFGDLAELLKGTVQ